MRFPHVAVQVAVSLQSAEHVSKYCNLQVDFYKGHRTLAKLARRTGESHFESRADRENCLSTNVQPVFDIGTYNIENWLHVCIDRGK